MHRGKVCIKAARQLGSYAARIIRCLDAKMRRSKVGYEKRNFYSSLRAIAWQSSENCHPELDSGSINVNLSVGKVEPSPAFVMFADAHEQLLPLTKREGNSFTDKVHSLFTTHHSLLLTDTIFSRFASLFSLKAAAFTLAEVLITLGIIGVVAAMAMPSLIQNHKEKETVVKLKKINSTLQNAYNLMRQEEFGGTVTSIRDFGWYNSDFVHTFTKYLKVQKVCYLENIKECYDDSKISYKTLSNGRGSSYFGWLDKNAFVLNDGVLVLVAERATNNYIRLLVDLNGPKKPNTFGKDVFMFVLNEQKIFPLGNIDLNANGDLKYDTDGSCSKTGKCYSCSGNGLACAAWVIYMENMDYLKK